MLKLSSLCNLPGVTCYLVLSLFAVLVRQSEKAKNLSDNMDLHEYVK